MKKYLKIEIHYLFDKLNEQQIDDAFTIRNYMKSLNKQERKKFIKQTDEITFKKLIQELFDFYHFLAKAIKHGAEPIEQYYAIPTNRTISKVMARNALNTLLDGYGVDTAYFGTEIKTAEETLITFIEQQ